MFGLVKCRLPYTFCIVLLMVIGLGQVYIFVANRPFAGYVKMKLAEVSKSLSNDEKSARPPGPVHILLLSYARTGSSFVGDILQSYPGAFYYFEPLHFIGESVINSSYPEAKFLLKRLFQCQLSKVPGFMIWQLNHKRYMKLKRNYRYWRDCNKKSTCYNSHFLDTYCSKHNAVVIKSIRMTLREAATLYDDFPELNLKIVYLSRDPRGTMNSRMRDFIKSWCKKDLKCRDPKQFCATLEDDLVVACRLLNQRPQEFTIIRYEDLSREPYQYARSIAKFLGYNSTKEMEIFLKNHTSTTVQKAGDGLHFLYNTYRNSMLTSMKWRQEMNFTRAMDVQNSCKDVLGALGYHVYNNSSTMRSDVYLDADLQRSVVNFCIGH